MRAVLEGNTCAVAFLTEVYHVHQRVRIGLREKLAGVESRLVVLRQNVSVRVQQEQSVEIACLRAVLQRLFRVLSGVQSVHTVFQPPLHLLGALRHTQQAFRLGGEVAQLAVIALLLDVLDRMIQPLFGSRDVQAARKQENTAEKQNAGRDFQWHDFPPQELSFLTFHRCLP